MARHLGRYSLLDIVSTMPASLATTCGPTWLTLGAHDVDLFRKAGQVRTRGSLGELHTGLDAAGCETGPWLARGKAEVIGAGRSEADRSSRFGRSRGRYTAAARTRSGFGDGDDVDVPPPRAVTDLELFQERVQRLFVGCRHPEEEENATAAARTALRESKQTLVAPPQFEIAAQHRLAVGDTTADGVDANDLGSRGTATSGTAARVTELVQVRRELAPQVRAYR